MKHKSTLTRPANSPPSYRDETYLDQHLQGRIKLCPKCQVRGMS